MRRSGVMRSCDRSASRLGILLLVFVAISMTGCGEPVIFTAGPEPFLGEFMSTLRVSELVCNSIGCITMLGFGTWYITQYTSDPAHGETSNLLMGGGFVFLGLLMIYALKMVVTTMTVRFDPAAREITCHREIIGFRQRDWKLSYDGVTKVAWVRTKNALTSFNIMSDKGTFCSIDVEHSSPEMQAKIEGMCRAELGDLCR